MQSKQLSVRFDSKTFALIRQEKVIANDASLAKTINRLIKERFELTETQDLTEKLVQLTTKQFLNETKEQTIKENELLFEIKNDLKKIEKKLDRRLKNE